MQRLSNRKWYITNGALATIKVLRKLFFDASTLQQASVIVFGENSYPFDLIGKAKREKPKKRITSIDRFFML
ncbi:hypothetical protein SJDPG12_00055 [Porphyromonas gingivalis SJD12]|nr:hypothetical protein SJDPG12_00055 [Porphyromonas gingivalis SJD12]